MQVGNYWITWNGYGHIVTDSTGQVVFCAMKAETCKLWIAEQAE